jgi:acyl carrier protein
MSGTTESRIATIAGRMLVKRGCKPDPAPHENLRDAGLTSLDMVNLVLAIEMEFDIEVPQEAMTPENFDTIAAIEALLRITAKAA